MYTVHDERLEKTVRSQRPDLGVDDRVAIILEKGDD